VKGLKIQLQGLDKALKDLHKFKSKTADEVASEIKTTAFDIERDAKAAAPVDLGNLRQGIRVTSVTKMSAEVESQASYSPYVEWGTGGLVNVPADLSQYAAQFKGKGIKKVNLPARPFFYNSVFKNMKNLVERLKRISH
jgi:HK97 gp10 family phage protein